MGHKLALHILCLVVALAGLEGIMPDAAMSAMDQMPGCCSGMMTTAMPAADCGCPQDSPCRIQKQSGHFLVLALPASGFPSSPPAGGSLVIALFKQESAWPGIWQPLAWAHPPPGPLYLKTSRLLI